MNSLTVQMAKILEDYSEEVQEKVDKAIEETAKEAVQRLKNTSPQNKGEYAKGWAVKKEVKGLVIYNKKKPQLTHLLELGHAKVSGGRVSGRPHIKPVEEWANQEVVRKVENDL